MNQTSRLFSPINLRNLSLKNRIVMPPMCMYRAQDGIANDWHRVHYATRAIGGAGLIIVEATGICPEGRISDNCLGLWNDEQEQAHRALVDLVHSFGGMIGIQINHAGRKSEVTGITPEAPSPIAYDDASRVPAEMTADDIANTTEEFKMAAERALRVGYDVLELHMAHGYLLNQFLSPLTNQRTDDYGGNAENRSRFSREVVEAVSGVWDENKPLFIRITAEDYDDDGNHTEDLAEIVNRIKSAGHGIDAVDVSTGGVIPVAPKAFPGYQIPHAKLIRERTGLPVIGGGLITDARQSEDIIGDGIDMVFTGRELLRNPYFPLTAAKELGTEIEWPKSYERAKPR